MPVLLDVYAHPPIRAPKLCLCTQEEQAASAGASREPAVSRRLQQKTIKRVRFLQNVAASQPALRLEAKGGTKKRRRKTAVSERLKNFSGLAASLAEAAKEVSIKMFCNLVHSMD